MFRVYDNDKPADCHHHQVDTIWANSDFETLLDACEYALNWMGPQACDLSKLLLNRRHDYSGYGDIIEIREVERIKR